MFIEIKTKGQMNPKDSNVYRNKNKRSKESEGFKCL